MVLVIKKKGESKDSIFRKFSRSYLEEKISDDVRRKQFYKKPSLLRKEKEKERRIMRSRNMRVRTPRIKKI